MPIEPLDPLEEDEYEVITYTADIPEGWSAFAWGMYLDFVENTGARDNTALQEMFHYSYFTKGGPTTSRHEMQEYLRDYMRKFYNVNFDDYFEWDDYRRWYDNRN